MRVAKVGIVSFGVGNITSLRNAFAAIGVDVFVAADPAQLDAATHAVLPGVGAFQNGMQRLRAHGFEEPVRRWVGDGRPLLGVCLGMQLFATVGEEHGLADGLGFIPGRCTVLATGGLRLPHIGWNDAVASREGVLQAGLPRECYYFVHSFALVPDDPAVVALLCTYGTPFAAAVEHGNIFGVQFHPEKSHRAGLALLRRFTEVRC